MTVSVTRDPKCAKIRKYWPREELGSSAYSSYSPGVKGERGRVVVEGGREGQRCGARDTSTTCLLGPLSLLLGTVVNV